MVDISVECYLKVLKGALLGPTCKTCECIKGIDKYCDGMTKLIIKLEKSINNGKNGNRETKHQ